MTLKTEVTPVNTLYRDEGIDVSLSFSGTYEDCLTQFKNELDKLVARVESMYSGLKDSIVFNIYAESCGYDGVDELADVEFDVPETEHEFQHRQMKLNNIKHVLIAREAYQEFKRNRENEATLQNKAKFEKELETLKKKYGVK